MKFRGGKKVKGREREREGLRSERKKNRGWSRRESGRKIKGEGGRKERIEVKKRGKEKRNIENTKVER